jgi:hypothetical protein
LPSSRINTNVIVLSLDDEEDTKPKRKVDKYSIEDDFFLLRKPKRLRATYGRQIKRQIPPSQSNGESSPKPIFKKPPKSTLLVTSFAMICSPT